MKDNVMIKQSKQQSVLFHSTGWGRGAPSDRFGSLCLSGGKHNLPGLVGEWKVESDTVHFGIDGNHRYEKGGIRRINQNSGENGSQHVWRRNI